MKTTFIIILVLAVLGGLIYLAVSILNKESAGGYSASEVATGVAAVKIKKNTDKDLALAKAQELYRAALFNGDDLSSGPCLSNEVIDDWVADIAHNPRQAADDLPENQCSAYRDGTANHFVELDLAGNLIRAE